MYIWLLLLFWRFSDRFGQVRDIVLTHVLIHLVGDVLLSDPRRFTGWDAFDTELTVILQYIEFTIDIGDIHGMER